MVFEEREIQNWEHDNRIVAKRVTLSGSTAHIIKDATTTANITYIGRGARGLAKSADGWFISKIDTTDELDVTSAIDSWDNRVGADYA